MKTDYGTEDLNETILILERLFSVEVALAFLEHVEESKSLVETLESDPNNEDAKKKAEALAERTGFTFWYDKAVVTSDNYDDILWAIYQPKSANIEAMKALTWQIQTFVQYDHTPGVWEHSHSC